MTGQSQVLVDEPLRRGMQWDESDLVTLAADAQMHDALTALDIFHPQPAEFFPADAVIEQGGQKWRGPAYLSASLRGVPPAASGPAHHRAPEYCLSCRLRWGA